MYSQFIICAALAVVFSTNAFSGSNIRETKHNLSNKITAVEDDDLCVYCHTPSTAKNIINSFDLWNKSTLNSAFIMYGTTETQSNDKVSNNASMACLSCHDGVSAVNVLAGLAKLDSILSTNVIDDSGSGYNPSTFKGDIKNTHPISVVYQAGRASLKTTNSVLTEWNSMKTIDDLLRNNRVECGSCHDPHEASNGRFLRVDNQGSKLCLGCHDK